MSSRDDSKLPPLPDGARSALSAFRRERPSSHQQSRIHAALREADARRSLPREQASTRPARTWPDRRALWVVMGAALASVLLTVGVQRSGGDGTAPILRQALPAREVSFQVPEGGGWVSLPWTLDQHPAGPAMVHLDTPAELDFQQHSSHLPSVQLVSCQGDRCLHRFTAEAGLAAEPLRVRIHRPGRYVLNVSHVSQERHIDESFVVRAEP